MPDMPWHSLRTASRLLIRKDVDLVVDGLQNVPATGGVILAARHYHHLYDGAALVSTLPRPASIIVGLDWIESGVLKTSMLAACRAAKWPVVLRSRPAHPVDPAEARALLRSATKSVVEQLHAGRIVILFPEAYPTIDPTWTPKSGDEVLPFEPGAIRLARIASKGIAPVPIIPVGLDYQQGRKWSLIIRFGSPFLDDPHEPPVQASARLRDQVIALSGLNHAAAVPTSGAITGFAAEVS
jgi:putative membrane protein